MPRFRPHVFCRQLFYHLFWPLSVPIYLVMETFYKLPDQKDYHIGFQVALARARRQSMIPQSPSDILYMLVTVGVQLIFVRMLLIVLGAWNPVGDTADVVKFSLPLYLLFFVKSLAIAGKYAYMPKYAYGRLANMSAQEFHSYHLIRWVQPLAVYLKREVSQTALR